MPLTPELETWTEMINKEEKWTKMLSRIPHRHQAYLPLTLVVVELIPMDRCSNNHCFNYSTIFNLGNSSHPLTFILLLQIESFRSTPTIFWWIIYLCRWNTLRAQCKRSEVLSKKVPGFYQVSGCFYSNCQSWTMYGPWRLDLLILTNYYQFLPL